MTNNINNTNTIYSCNTFIKKERPLENYIFQYGCRCNVRKSLWLLLLWQSLASDVTWKHKFFFKTSPPILLAVFLQNLVKQILHVFKHIIAGILSGWTCHSMPHVRFYPWLFLESFSISWRVLIKISITDQLSDNK